MVWACYFNYRTDIVVSKKKIQITLKFKFRIEWYNRPQKRFSFTSLSFILFIVRALFSQNTWLNFVLFFKNRVFFAHQWFLNILFIYVLLCYFQMHRSMVWCESQLSRASRRLEILLFYFFDTKKNNNDFIP